MFRPHETLGAPHPPLSDYYGCEGERRAFVLGIFERTAGDYEKVERLMALGTGSWYRRDALRRAGLAPGMAVLDIGAGTGLVAREAARIVGNPALVTGVDPCPGMIGKAKVPPGVRMVAGSAESIPAADDSADFLSMGYALRHISDLTAAFREFHRVLKPGGRVCVLEITRPDNVCLHSMMKAYMRRIVPLAAKLVARDRNMPTLMRYYWDTIESCVAPPAILAVLEAAGFTRIRRHVELGIFSEYCAIKAARPFVIEAK